MRMFSKVFFLIFCIATLAFAQPPKHLMVNDESGAVRKQLDELFILTAKKEYAKAAKLIAYHGTDTARRYKSPLNPKDSSELELATFFCTNLQGSRDALDSLRYHQFYMSMEDKIMLYSWKMIAFIKDGGSDTTTFSFVKSKDKFLFAGVR